MQANGGCLAKDQVAHLCHAVGMAKHGELRASPPFFHLDGRAAFSCILPIAAVGERKITTLEGLIENGKPNKLQQAFIDEQAAQCGYCISGMVMRAETLLRVNRHPTDDEIRQHMRPNLCRCGTHAAIMRAIKRAAVA